MVQCMVGGWPRWSVSLIYVHVYISNYRHVNVHFNVNKGKWYCALLDDDRLLEVIWVVSVRSSIILIKLK